MSVTNMIQSNVILLSKSVVSSLLKGKELKIISQIEDAYKDFEKGTSSLPHSVFLRFPETPQNRIISLPAYLAGKNPVAGMKWIASFPGNVNRGIDRASAVIILNSLETGQAVSFLEGSIISAKRTAASAALAAQQIHQSIPDSIGLIGCGPINLEIFRFISVVFTSIKNVYIYDIDVDRATQFVEKIKTASSAHVVICENHTSVFAQTKLISFATTSSTPYLRNPSVIQPYTTILHISLRDLSPEIILSGVNIVDNVDHVNREKTSIHLTSEKAGNTDFILGNIGQVLLKKLMLPKDARPVIFSPFGLGVLDMKLAQYVYSMALKKKQGIKVDNFFSTNDT